MTTTATETPVFQVGDHVRYTGNTIGEYQQRRNIGRTGVVTGASATQIDVRWDSPMDWDSDDPTGVFPRNLGRIDSPATSVAERFPEGSEFYIEDSSLLRCWYTGQTVAAGEVFFGAGWHHAQVTDRPARDHYGDGRANINVRMLDRTRDDATSTQWVADTFLTVPWSRRPFAVGDRVRYAGNERGRFMTPEDIGVIGTVVSGSDDAILVRIETATAAYSEGAEVNFYAWNFEHIDGASDSEAPAATVAEHERLLTAEQAESARLRAEVERLTRWRERSIADVRVIGEVFTQAAIDNDMCGKYDEAVEEANGRMTIHSLPERESDGTVTWVEEYRVRVTRTDSFTGRRNDDDYNQERAQAVADEADELEEYALISLLRDNGSHERTDDDVEIEWSIDD